MSLLRLQVLFSGFIYIGADVLSAGAACFLLGPPVGAGSETQKVFVASAALGRWF